MNNKSRRPYLHACIFLFVSFFVMVSDAGSQETEFVHPGLLNNLEEMEFVRRMVLEKKYPWKAAYDSMLAGKLVNLERFAVDSKRASSLDWEPRAVEYIAERSGSPDLMREDFSAAYIHSWIWFIRKDTAHAKKAVEILNAWGKTFRGFNLENKNPLLAGFNVPAGLYAAEIMRYTWNGWKKEDIRVFEEMLLKAVWPAVKNGADRPENRMRDIDENHPNGNWEATTMAVMTGIAIFTDDREKFNHALSYWYGPSPSTGNPKGRLRRYIWKDGKCQETCRDLVHTQVGMNALNHMAEMAWKQGVDLYGDLDNRLLKGLEYHVPLIMEKPGFTNPCAPRALRLTGRWCPVYEMAYNHYHNRENMDCPWLEEAILHTRPEGFWRSYGLSSLTHASLPPLPKGYNPGNPDPEPEKFTPNYDPEKIPEYTLPELLSTPGGGKILSAGDWEQERRPEILSLFEREVYGQVPDQYDSMRFIPLQKQTVLGGMATMEHILIRVYRNFDSVDIMLALVIPAGEGPHPAFLLINHRGVKGQEPPPTEPDGYWPVSYIVEKGYACAILNVKDVAPDHRDEYRSGVIRRLYPEQLFRGDGMAALGAWAWGASRIMDYFEECPAIDHGKVALAGHSRSGKAALWCGARDTRFGLVISNNSGCGGAAISARAYGETVRRINRRYPHWFCDNFNRYNENEPALPVDQHMLIALVAPRPVYIASATEDRWADPEGEFLSGVHAGPAYELYGLKGPGSRKQPPADAPLQEGSVAYHLRTGRHGLTLYDWEQFIQFADKHFK